MFKKPCLLNGFQCGFYFVIQGPTVLPLTKSWGSLWSRPTLNTGISGRTWVPGGTWISWRSVEALLAPLPGQAGVSRTSRRTRVTRVTGQTRPSRTNTGDARGACKRVHSGGYFCGAHEKHHRARLRKRNMGVILKCAIWTKYYHKSTIFVQQLV